MQTIKRSNGFTLIELMITVGIVAVLAGIAIPAYTGYIDTTKIQAAKHNAMTLAGFEDTYFYENESYLAGNYTPGGDVTTLPNALGWRPDGDKDQFIYTVTPCGTGPITKCYKVTVTFTDGGAIAESFERNPAP
jgi:type IV pilus assembly protein PilE